jgi:hypothetical protein
MTRTPTPLAATATPTATATQTPAAGTRTLTFDHLLNPERVFPAEYPPGLIAWEANAWYLSGPWGLFTTQSLTFNGVGPTSASFTFLRPGRVIQLEAYNGGSGASEVSLRCADQTTRTATVGAGSLATISTDWSGNCSGPVTLESTNGWDTNFDNLVVSIS